MNSKEEEKAEKGLCEDQLDINACRSCARDFTTSKSATHKVLCLSTSNISSTTLKRCNVCEADWEESTNPAEVGDSDISFEHLLDFIQEKPTFAVPGNLPWNDDVPPTIRTFLKDPAVKTLFLYQSKSCIYAKLEPLNLDSPEMCWYFLKILPSTMTEDEDVADLENVQFGTLKSNELLSCQERIFSLFRNEILGKCATFDPETQYFKPEFSKNFYSFVSRLIKTCSVNMRQTILVAPGVFTEKCGDVKEVANYVSDAKSLTYVEVLSLNWIQQCNEMTSFQVIDIISQAKEPLQDMAMLKPSLKTLSHLNKELNSAFFEQIKNVLKSEKSPFVPYFDQLKLNIADSMEAIKVRQATLLTIEDSCHKFHNSSLKDAPLHLADLVDHVAKFYQDTNAKRENSYSTDDLVKMVCNSVIVRCTCDISTDNICRGYKSSIEDINESIALCDLCKTMFVQASNQRRIRFNKEGSFRRIALFVQRCKELIQIIEGAELFGKWDEGNTNELFPLQSRRHQHHFDNVLLEIMLTFDRFLEHLSKNQSELLDLDSLKWITIKQRYESIITKVEMLCRNSINNVFTPNMEVEEGIEILGYFSHLSKQHGVNHLYAEKANQLFRRLLETIPSVRCEISKLGYLFHTDDHRLTDIAVKAHDFERKIVEPMENITKAQWFPTTSLGELAKSEQSKLHATVEAFISKIFAKWGQKVAKFKFVDKLNVPLMRNKPKNPKFLECNLEINILENLQNAVLWHNLGRDVQAATGCSSETCVSVVNLFHDVQQAIGDYNQTVKMLLESRTNFFSFLMEFLNGTQYPGLVGQTWLTLAIQSPEINDWKLATAQLKEKYLMFKSTEVKINSALGDIGMLSLLIFDNISNLPLTMEDYETIKNQKFEEFCNKGYELYNSLTLDLMTVKSTFQEDAEKLEYDWLNYLDEKDKLFDKSITNCISEGLLQVENVMSDKEKHPVLKLKIDNNKEVSQTKNMQLPMVTILDEMLALVNRFPSFRDIMTKADVIHTRKLIPGSRDSLESIYKRISAKTTEVFSNFLDSLSQWAQYEEILCVNPATFFEAYKKSGPKIEVIKQDIAGYAKIAQKIEAMEPVGEIGFLRVDYADLQKDLLNLSGIWKTHFEQLLV